RLDMIADMQVLMPISVKEQQKIAKFFRSLDRKIALETARLEKLKQIKLACLDKMFV
ncbi:HsdS protein, partial [gut metagenome]